MPGLQKSVRLPVDTIREVERLMKETGKDFSGVTKDLLQEAIKIRRCPGVTFADGLRGRRARIAGTGIEIWEVIATLQSVDNDIKRLETAYHWLAPEQLRAAIAYYSAYPKEVDQQIGKNAQWNEEAIRERYPILKSSV